MTGKVYIELLIGFSHAADVSFGAQVLDDEDEEEVESLPIRTRSGTAIFNIDAMLPTSSAAASANGTRRANLTIFANL